MKDIPEDVLAFISRVTLLATNHGGWFDRDGCKVMFPICDEGNRLLRKYDPALEDAPHE